MMHARNLRSRQSPFSSSQLRGGLTIELNAALLGRACRRRENRQSLRTVIERPQGSRRADDVAGDCRLAEYAAASRGRTRIRLHVPRTSRMCLLEKADHLTVGILSPRSLPDLQERDLHEPILRNADAGIIAADVRSRYALGTSSLRSAGIEKREPLRPLKMNQAVPPPLVKTLHDLKRSLRNARRETARCESDGRQYHGFTPASIRCAGHTVACIVCACMSAEQRSSPLRYRRCFGPVQGRFSRRRAERALHQIFLPPACVMLRPSWRKSLG
jgi:hypothetical protein